jgi:hypothetical protein
MESTDAASRAMKACKGLMMKGSEITVKLADNRFAKPGDREREEREERWRNKEVPLADLYYKPSPQPDVPLTREEEARRRALNLALHLTPTPEFRWISPLTPVSFLYRREDTINKAFPIDYKRTTPRVIELRRKILGSTPRLH